MLNYGRFRKHLTTRINPGCLSGIRKEAYNAIVFLGLTRLVHVNIGDEMIIL